MIRSAPALLAGLLAGTLAGTLSCSSAPEAPAPAPSGPPPAPSGPAPQHIDQATFKNGVFSGAFRHLIDVRSPAEYAAGHVPGSRNIPVEEVEARMGELKALAPGPIHLICETGNRAGYVAKQLSAEGLQTVVVLGGTHAWREADLPLTAGATP